MFTKHSLWFISEAILGVTAMCSEASEARPTKRALFLLPSISLLFNAVFGSVDEDEDDFPPTLMTSDDFVDTSVDDHTGFLAKVGGQTDIGDDEDVKTFGFEPSGTRGDEND